MPRGENTIVQKHRTVSSSRYFQLSLYGKAVKGELHSPLFPLLAHQVYLELIESIYRTVLFLSAEPIYCGTRKQYSVEKVLYQSILSEYRESGNRVKDRNIWRELVMKERSFE